MKRIILVGILLTLIFITGCTKKANVMCTLTNKDENHTNDYILSATFKDDKLLTMNLTGTSIYGETSSTQAAYMVIKEGYDNLNSIDNSIITEVYYANNKLYFRLQLYTDKVNDKGLEYLQDKFSISKGYPTYDDFMSYTKKNNYECY